MDRIPSDVEVAVRAAGESSRPYGGELPDVYRRARRRRTHRRAAAAATAVVVAAGLVGAGLTVRRHDRAAYQPAVVAPPAGPAQRLLLSHAIGRYTTARQTEPVQLGGPVAVGELTPDGALVAHPVHGADGYHKAIALPDGRLVSLGPRNTAPGVDREGGVNGEHLEMLLSVETPGGDLVQRDIRREGEPVRLVAATATTAYLLRPPGLVEHDLASGLERLVITSMTGPVRDDELPALDASDVAGQRLVVAESARPCRPLILDLSSLSGLLDLPVTSLGCQAVSGLRLSPSTGRVAVTYQREGAVRVAVFSTEDGKVLADRPAATAGDKAHQVTVDVAWLDERNLRVVAVPSGPGLHVLKPFTIPT